MGGWRWFALATCAAVVANSVRLRLRVRALPVADQPGSPGPPGPPVHAFLATRGVGLPDEARRAASAHAARVGAEVLDLVPADLPPERFLDLARAVHTGKYRNNRFAPGRGAAQALCVDRDVLTRAGVKEREDFLPTELAAVTRRLKRYAPSTSDLAVVPGLTASSGDGAAERVRVRSAGIGRLHRPTFALPAVRTGALVLACLADPRWGAAAVAACAAQPLLVSAGRVTPGSRAHLTAPARRLAAWPAHLLAPARRTAPSPEDDQRRARYQADIAAGVERFLQPRRDDCPWCGSTQLVFRAKTVDVELRKPGRFRYDQCRGCDHVFQNPALNSDGLEFYYRDVYDGLMGEFAEERFGASDLGYRARARMLPSSVKPRRWLDVGGGHGHFCLAASAMLPDVVFDAVDMGDGIEEAHRRGWVHDIYRSMFPDVADEITGQYDVISMFHYLEHTADPRRELDAAAQALPAGGHLLIEVPNPQAPSFSLFRGMWVGLASGQHLHMFAPDTLGQALADRGLRVVRTQFGSSHLPGDAMGAVLLLTQRLQPEPDLPWLPYGPTPWRRARRLAAVAVTAPLFPLATVVDALMMPYMVTGRRANTYRIVAQKIT